MDEALRPAYAFEAVRDIPYVALPSRLAVALIEPDIIEPDLNPIATLFSVRRAGCALKSEALGQALQELNVSVEYVVVPFLWHTTLLSFKNPPPGDVLVHAMGLAPAYHTYLLGTITDRRFVLDATWDSPLASVGAPVNVFDVSGPTEQIAVIPCGEARTFATAAEAARYRLAIYQKRRSDNSLGAVGRRAAFDRFVEGLNLWLHKIRTSVQKL